MSGAPAKRRRIVTDADAAAASARAVAAAFRELNGGGGEDDEMNEDEVDEDEAVEPAAGLAALPVELLAHVMRYLCGDPRLAATRGRLPHAPPRHVLALRAVSRRFALAVASLIAPSCGPFVNVSLNVDENKRGASALDAKSVAAALRTLAAPRLSVAFSNTRASLMRHARLTLRVTTAPSTDPKRFVKTLALTAAERETLACFSAVLLKHGGGRIDATAVERLGAHLDLLRGVARYVELGVGGSSIAADLGPLFRDGVPHVLDVSNLMRTYGTQPQHIASLAAAPRVAAANMDAENFATLHKAVAVRGGVLVGHSPFVRDTLYAVQSAPAPAISKAQSDAAIETALDSLDAWMQTNTGEAGAAYDAFGRLRHAETMALELCFSNSSKFENNNVLVRRFLARLRARDQALAERAVSELMPRYVFNGYMSFDDRAPRARLLLEIGVPPSTELFMACARTREALNVFLAHFALREAALATWCNARTPSGPMVAEVLISEGKIAQFMTLLEHARGAARDEILVTGPFSRSSPLDTVMFQGHDLGDDDIRRLATRQHLEKLGMREPRKGGFARTSLEYAFFLLRERYARHLCVVAQEMGIDWRRQRLVQMMLEGLRNQQANSSAPAYGIRLLAAYIRENGIDVASKMEGSTETPLEFARRVQLGAEVEALVTPVVPRPWGVARAP